jgi:hypothetical protein
MSHRSRIFLAVLSLAVVSLAGAAFATNPSGLTSTTPVRGHLDRVTSSTTTSSWNRRTKRRPMSRSPRSRSPRAVRRDGITILVSWSSSSNPGAVTFYDQNCKSEVHHAGEAFVESSDEPGLARNAGTVNAVVHATYIVPTSGSPAQPTPLRIDDPQPKDCNVT